MQQKVKTSVSICPKYLSPVDGGGAGRGAVHGVPTPLPDHGYVTMAAVLLRVHIPVAFTTRISDVVGTHFPTCLAKCGGGIS